MLTRVAFGTASRWTALAVCASGSVLLHAGVLLANLTASDALPGPTRTGHPTSAAVAVRLAPDFERLAAPGAGRPGNSASTPQPADRHARESGHPRSPPTAVPAADEVDPRVRGDDGTAAGVAVSAANAAGTEQAEAPYLPRSELSLGPAPQQAIDLAYPDLAPLGRFRAVLTLFIDDQGVVQRVRFDEAGDAGLPPVLEDTARQTFLRSPFTPGEVAGRPVRSQLRIEVEFAAETLSESRPEPPPSAQTTQTSASTRR